MAPSTYQNERKGKDCARRQKMDERRERKKGRESEGKGMSSK